MASPGELIDLVSKSLGLPRPAVFSVHRYLREAGLITQGGRGTSAAKMTCRDAAVLLIGSASPGELKNSPLLIERPGALVSPTGKWMTTFTSISELAALPDDHTFLDGVEALIAAAANGTMQRAAEDIEGGPVDLVHDMSPALNIEVTIYGPTPRGAIQLEEMVTDTEDNQFRFRDHFDRHFYRNRRAGEKKGNLAWIDISRPKEMDSDLRTSATFTHRTIAAVGQMLSASSAAVPN